MRKTKLNYLKLYYKGKPYEFTRLGDDITDTMSENILGRMYVLFRIEGFDEPIYILYSTFSDRTYYSLKAKGDGYSYLSDMVVDYRSGELLSELVQLTTHVSNVYGGLAFTSFTLEKQ